MGTLFPHQGGLRIIDFSVFGFGVPPPSASDRIGKAEPGGKQGPRPEVRALERAEGPINSIGNPPCSIFRSGSWVQGWDLGREAPGSCFGPFSAVGS